MIHRPPARPRPSPRPGLTSPLVLLLVLAASTPLAAQRSAPPAPESTPIPQDSVAEAVERFRQLQTRLEGVQQEALGGNPELMEEQAAIQAEIERAMLAAHPELREPLRDRIPAIGREAAAARQGRDQAKLQALNEEYRAIMARVEEAQAQVLEQQDLRDRLSDFQASMMDAMVEVDPEIEGVFQRLQVLAGRLERSLGG